MATRSLHSFVWLAAVLIGGCAASPPPAQGGGDAGDVCGGLPPPFNPPIVCLRIEEHPSGCFTIEREPGPNGGLRIPRQIVCPFAR